MGLLVDGQWHNEWYDTKSSGGEFIRQDAQFRNVITADGSNGSFKAEPGRYHLYVSLACPWAHRTLIFRKLKQLEKLIGVTIVKPEMLQHGWELAEGGDSGPIPNIRYMHQVYTTAQPNYSGRVTVPVLWDKQTNSIVNNESSEIIRMMNTAFNDFTEVKTDYYPPELRGAIDEVNALVYDNINNGVYKCGFATTQEAYEEAFVALFDTLDWLEGRLSKQRYLAGEQITEADWRLFTTLVRFDAVYVGHFKTNLRRIADYPNLWAYTRELYQVPGVSSTVNTHHIKHHYYGSHESINPTRIVPMGPTINFTAPHHRDTTLTPLIDAAE